MSTPKPPRQRQPRGPPQQQTYNANNNAPTPPPSGGPSAPQPASMPSDALAAPDLIPPTPTGQKTNTTLNLTVLRRYKPTIQSILSIASNAVLYVFTPGTGAWDKSGIEGTLFVCDCTTPPSIDGNGMMSGKVEADMEENFCLVVFNRKGMENFILELWMVHDVEVSGELLIFRYSDNGDGGESGAEKVRGLWMHEDSDGTRKVNSDVVIKSWDKARKAKLAAAERAARGMVFEESAGNGGGQRGQRGQGGLGRRISLTDLFGGGV